jgi:parvulin-like peptidyl-prolyl isomerase
MSRKEAHSEVTPVSNKSLNRKRRIVLLASGVAVIAICVALRLLMGGSSASAQIPNPFQKKQPPQQATQASAEQPTGGQKQGEAAAPPAKHDVMAIVNGQDIRRDALGTACVERFGKDTLEGLVNKRLILHYCRNRNIEVTDQEVDAEIDRMAKRFKIGRDQWLQMLERERNITPEQYKRDILWPTLALRKCAADQLTISDAQLTEAYEAQYGPAVKCRLIVVTDKKLAEQIHRQVTDRPDDFARLAMQHSVDVNSASIGGLIQPIRHHLGDPNIERAVFALQPKPPNQISSIIPINDQFAILKCEGQMPARNVPIESVKEELTEQLRESKLREVAAKLFKQLQDASTVQNVWNNPQLRAQMPGVVATINGEQIPYSELAEECLMRYGRQVLEVEISHLLLHQALSKGKVTVTEQDLNEEIGHAAQLAGVVDKEGKPDMAKWIESATKDQGVTKDEYLRDSVWPSAALKKLTNGSIQVTKEDLLKGFQANYSERVRCRAIVLPNMRRAQEVWAKARQNDSMDYFGDLAAENSIEPSSKSLRGEVPPIRKFGGQPQLEEVAFNLKPNELSGIIQLADKFVILKCEGRTQPVEVNPKEVHDILYQDIFEKKLRMAMSEKFDDLKSKARIDNFLAGTSQSPERKSGEVPGGVTGGATPGSAPRVDQAIRQASGPERNDQAVRPLPGPPTR